MDYLDSLEDKSIYIIREAYSRFKDIGLLWSIGKDSTTLLWLCRKAFFGNIPFPVIHIDTSYKFKEIYSFRDVYAKRWKLELSISKNAQALKAGMSPVKEKFACCNELKTEALKQTLEKLSLKALFLGIRRDEHGIRAKERYFSPRTTDFVWNYQQQPVELWDMYCAGIGDNSHIRVHPLLHWTELDIWRYIRRERIPVVDLYFAKKGKRYRSIGCQSCCAPVISKADTLAKIIRELENTLVAERSGRAQDKENTYVMQKLRSLGYM